MVKKTTKPFIYSEAQRQFIFENYKGISNQELTELFNKKFGTNLTRAQIKNYKGNNSLDSGLTGYYAKGHVPQNKGLKQTEYMSNEAIERTKATRFKKGQVAPNYKPVSYERICSKDGYILIKVSDVGRWDERWMHKHRVVWEAEYGPIPDDHRLIFLNGNRTDVRLENLKCVPKGISAIINKNDLYSVGSPELQEAAIKTAELMIQTSKKRKKG